MPSPVIPTERLRIDRLTPSDALQMFEYRSDPAVCRYQSFQPGSLADIEAFIEEIQQVAFDSPGTWFQFAVRDRDTGRLIGDMGAHFPSSDPRWKGVASATFLEEVERLVFERGFVIENIDVTAIAQEPTLGPHLPAMRARVADLLRLPADRVSVKAKTGEGVGEIGTSQAIATRVVVLLAKR